MKAGIYYNKKRLPENNAYLQSVKDLFSAKGIVCEIINDTDELNGLDVLLVFGGDGTILNVAAECAKRSIKILGINHGHLGFLTEFQPENVEEAINLVCGKNFTVKRLNMLEINYSDKTYLALNDLVIQRSTGGNDFSNTVELRAVIDGSLVDNYLSDGIIISTPTGSTAYSLSAGGSILTPDINAFIMTPICAHSLHSRPVVYNDNSTLEIMSLSENTLLNLVVDGKVVEVIANSSVTVKKADYFAEFITRGNSDFFNKLLIKLNIWSK